MYVLDENGNIVPADKVAEMLTTAYNSGEFSKYGLAGDDPRTSVSLFLAE